MPLIDTATLVRHAYQNRYCVVQVNTNGGTYDITRAIVEAAEEERAPVILQTSVKTVKMYGRRQLFEIFQALARYVSVPVTLHLDHCPDRSVISDCLAGGWNSVLFDAHELDVAENLLQTSEVVQEARIAFLAEMEARHVPRSAVDTFEVPGSFEIPLHAQLLAKTRRYTAIVAAGLVVDGGIYRHEFVADTVIKALMDVQLRTEVPVFSAVLTPQQFHESQVHYDFFRKHFAIKGIEVAEACATTLHGLERLRGQVAAGIV